MSYYNECLIINQSTIDIVDENICVTLLPSLSEYGFSDTSYHHVVASLDIIDDRILANPAFRHLLTRHPHLSVEKEMGGVHE